MKKQTLVTCIFNDASLVVDAVHELRRSGFSDDQLGFVVRYEVDEQGTNVLAREVISGLLGVSDKYLLPLSERTISREYDNTIITIETEQQNTPAKHNVGIIRSGVIGGTLGAIALLHLSNIGLTVVGGILVAIFGSSPLEQMSRYFLNMSIPIQSAYYYEQQFQAGYIIFIIKVLEQQQEVQDILRYHRAWSIEVH